MKANVLAKRKVGSSRSGNGCGCGCGCGVWVGLKTREDESFCVGVLSIRVSDSRTEWATITHRDRVRRRVIERERGGWKRLDVRLGLVLPRKTDEADDDHREENEDDDSAWDSD